MRLFKSTLLAFLGGLLIGVVLVGPSPVFALQTTTKPYQLVIPAATASTLLTGQKSAIDLALGLASMTPSAKGATVILALSAAAALAIGGMAGMPLMDTHYTQAQENDALAGGATNNLWPPNAALQAIGCANVNNCLGPGGLLITQQWPAPNPAKPAWTFSCGLSIPSGFGDYAVMVRGSTGNPAPPTGWTQYASAGCGGANWISMYHALNAANPMVAASPVSTQTTISTWIQGLTSGNADSTETNTQPDGQVTTPRPADTTTTIPIDVTTSQTTKTQTPASGDIIININVPPPSNTTITNSQTQVTNISTVSTVTGGGTTTTTDTATDTSTASCTTGGHTDKTFASTLQLHEQTWLATGLLALVTSLSSQVWSSTIPVYSISTHFGNYTIDFNSYAWFFTALKTVILAMASLYAVKLVFAGGGKAA